MKVKFCCDSGANIHSTHSEIIETQDLGYTDEQWNALDDDQKFEEVEEWANERLQMWWEDAE